MRLTSGRTTMNSTTRPSSIMTPSSMTYITSSLVNCSMPNNPVGSAIGATDWGFGEFEVDDLDLIAALLVEADRRAHQRGDAVELLLAALLIDHLALFVLGIDAVDQHGDRDPVDPSSLGHFGLGGVGNLVIVGLFGLLALVARRRRLSGPRWLPGNSLLTVTWPLLSAVALDSSRVWLERSTRPSGSKRSEVWVILL